MSKVKSKKQNISTNNGNGVANVLGLDTKQIGATLIGVLIGELIETATERLVKNMSSANGEDQEQKRHTSHHKHHANPVQAAVSKVEDQLEAVTPDVDDTVNAVRSTVSNVSPNLSNVIDGLRDAGRQLKEKSMLSLINSPDTVLEGISSTAVSAIDGIADSFGVKPQNTSKKKNKKKKKKN